MTKFAILAAVLVSISIVVESAPTPDYTRRFCGTNDAQYEGHPICGAFYQCVHGVMVPRLCAKGTIWNDGKIYLYIVLCMDVVLDESFSFRVQLL